MACAIYNLLSVAEYCEDQMYYETFIYSEANLVESKVELRISVSTLVEITIYLHMI